MRGWDSVTQGGSLRPGPAALAIMLAGLLLSLAPVSQTIENSIADLIQRLDKRTASPEIVLVDTGALRGNATSAWDSDRFPDLLDALGRAGARLILPVEPPPLNAGLPDARQLAALADLERRNRGGEAAAAGALADPWLEIGRRAEQHARTVAAVARLRNLVVAVPTFDGSPGSALPGSTCRKHALGAGPARDDDSRARRVRTVAPTPDGLCQAALGAGHVEFWNDPDEVVRRLELLLNASGTLVQSAALTARLAVTSPGGDPPLVTAGAITWDSNRIRTSGGPAILMRFYPAGDPARAFASINAENLLTSRATANGVAGKIVILGDIAGGEGHRYATPVGEQVPLSVLFATAMSNLMAGDYLVRAPWLSLLETALMLVIGLAALLWGQALPPTLAAMTGLLAVTGLLGAEAYLLSIGIWTQLATAAAFVPVCLATVRFLKPRAAVAVAAPPQAAANEYAPAAKAVNAADELDLAFSMLRHQPPTEHVKKRLYDVALEHARQRDLAKAERVLRHLVSLDPQYRNAGDKLKKLAGLRLAAPAAAPEANAPPAAPAPKPVPEKDDLSGQTIGRYQIEQPIGRGAMATVYLGRDPKINRRVAIKTIALAEEFSDTDLDNARTQFLREAESAGRLNHPNIISIYDAGEDGRVAYLAMEYFPGKPMSYYAQQGHLLPPGQVLDLMARAAEALHYAHKQHVVHRDVKPANLLYDATTDTFKITDFGIARLTDTSRTKTGIILGTPSYMSPEQLAGTGVTGQSDLFSLGITLYQLLTGAPPFRADSIPRLMQKIAHERHQPLAQIRDDLPATLDEVLDRALAKDPADRYPSGRAMALALRDCCSSVTASAAVQPT
jgi:serine/threonine-protein kinase